MNKTTEQERAHTLYNWPRTKDVAAAIGGVSEDFVLRRIRKPDAQGFRFTDVVRLGRDYAFNPAEVQRFIEAHRVQVDDAA